MLDTSRKRQLSELDSKLDTQHHVQKQKAETITTKTKQERADPTTVGKWKEVFYLYLQREVHISEVLTLLQFINTQFEISITERISIDRLTAAFKKQTGLKISNQEIGNLWIKIFNTPVQYSSENSQRFVNLQVLLNY